MLEFMLGSCTVVMAKPCNGIVKPTAATALPPSESEREMGLPLLHNSHVQELICEAADAERCAPPTIGAVGEFEALATPPVELMGEIPVNHKPGMPIVLSGPHGPVQVMPPQETGPGSRVRFRLAPPPEFRIQVPAGCGPGSLIRFERSDGAKVCVAVPPERQAGDSFDVTPPSMMVRVPDGAQAGDRVTFRHTLATGKNGREATEWCRTEIPKGVRPGFYFTARLPRPERCVGVEETDQDLLMQLQADFMHRGSCMEVHGFMEADVEDV
uniref:Uncharacterized protein n=1 Tax=Alexandrium monilatum TaxID=311494 RepID=A0A7S4SSJ8_9DINO